MTVLENAKFNKKSAVIIGKFDGVHKGHLKLLSIAADICKKDGLTPVVYTFSFENHQERILSDAQKLQIFENQGIDAVYTQKFTEEFKNTSPEEFVDILKNRFCAEHIIIGFNFRFGKDRGGDPSTMSELCKDANIKLTVAEPVLFDGKPISSTRIKSEIKSGNMANVYAMTGRYFSLTAPVEEGKQLGRKIGFPTANMKVSDLSLLPKHGVYATKVHTQHGTFPGITNIGSNPTVDCDGATKAETHIIGFSDNLYGSKLTIEFLQYLRDEERFANIKHLAAQLEYDTENAVKIFKNVLTS